MKRQKAEAAGRMAEEVAASWLEDQNWQILAKRRKTPLGEIDLIARHENTVVFVEVKWRRRADQLDLAIDEYRLHRVAAAAESVAHEYARNNEDIRIDVLLIAPGQFPRHIVNAWMP